MSVAVKSGQLGRILTCVGQMGIAVCSPGPKMLKRARSLLPPRGCWTTRHRKAAKLYHDGVWKIPLLAYVHHGLAHFKDTLKTRRRLNETAG